MDIDQLYNLIEQNDATGLSKFINENNLEVCDGKLFGKDPKYVADQTRTYDKLQMVRKIQMNSLYGALLNSASRFYDERIGQSVTLSGRSIAKHMDAQTNACITGEYDYIGDAIIYGDSVTGDTLIKTNFGTISIAELYNKCPKHQMTFGKEYGLYCQIKVFGLNQKTMTAELMPVKTVMRHKTTKQLYKVQLANQVEVNVTSDHSLMVKRDGILVEVKPTEIQSDDLFICMQDSGSIEYIGFNKVETLPPTEDFVYDISIATDNPFFFANDCLVHNTDSCAFSAWPVLQEQIQSGEIEWNKETVIQLYDAIADAVNESFPQFMTQAFNCPEANGKVIRAGRELVGTKGIFITKKRYAVLYYDKEGVRKDTDGGPGKLKAMGLELRRSDTPRFIQIFLEKLLMELLQGHTKEQIVQTIRDFKEQLKTRQPWEKGSPKRANKISWYTAQENKKGKVNMPGHVRAAKNWNTLRDMHNDKYSMQIFDGMKVVVCKLKQNPLNFTSVAYPVDETHLPKWFRELPFDVNAMETSIVDDKVDNIFDVLGWNLTEQTNVASTFNSWFS